MGLSFSAVEIRVVLVELRFDALDSQLETWSFCPDLGGFDFRAVDNYSKVDCSRTEPNHYM